MYYLSSEEVRRLNSAILPSLRVTGVSEDLRGWRWSEPPLYTVSQAGLPMYLVCGRYCPTGRDVYLHRVLGKKAEPGHKVRLGAAVHEVVRQTFLSFIEFREEEFNALYDKLLQMRGISATDSSIREACRAVWALILAECRGRFEAYKVERPYASSRDLMSSAVPYMVDHCVPGTLLGLSGVVRLDCYDYLRKIVYDLKVEAERRDWYRLYPTGYAMVLESVYETPIDVGCVVYLSFHGGRAVISRDLFHIDDDLRAWWVEERDVKLRIVDSGRDPGLPHICDPECIYRRHCGG